VHEAGNGRAEQSLRLAEQALALLAGTHQPSIGHAAEVVKRLLDDPWVVAHAYPVLNHH
jgi:hypothetical protein